MHTRKWFYRHFTALVRARGQPIFWPCFVHKICYTNEWAAYDTINNGQVLRNRKFAPSIGREDHEQDGRKELRFDRP